MKYEGHEKTQRARKEVHIQGLREVYILTPSNIRQPVRTRILWAIFSNKSVKIPSTNRQRSVRVGDDQAPARMAEASLLSSSSGDWMAKRRLRQIFRGT
jgi:hypothetical protein